MCTTWRSSTPTSPAFELDDLEVEDAAADLPVLGVLRALDRALHAPPFGEVAVDVERAGDDALDVLAQDVAEVGDPARVERLARREHDLHVRNRDWQDSVALRVGVADHLRDRGDVDLHRIDLEVRQTGAFGEPLREYFQTQRLVGMTLVGGVSSWRRARADAAQCGRARCARRCARAWRRHR
jgi:hypothetical protein